MSGNSKVYGHVIQVSNFSREEFEQIIKEGFQNAQSEASAKTKQISDTGYLTRKEVAKMLKLSLPQARITYRKRKVNNLKIIKWL